MCWGVCLQPSMLIAQLEICRFVAVSHTLFWVQTCPCSHNLIFKAVKIIYRCNGITQRPSQPYQLNKQHRGCGSFTGRYCYLDNAQIQNFQWLRLAPSKGPNRVGVSFPSVEDGNISLRNVVFYSYLEFRTMDKVRKPSDYDYRTPSSELFRF
jgi:hypothetical protein